MKIIEFFFLETDETDGSENCVDVMTPLEWPDEIPHRSEKFWERLAKKRAAKLSKEIGTKIRVIRIDSGEDKVTLH